MRLLKLLIAVSLCLILSVSVFAHPGGTDSSGGHYNRSTGEYHYHHGYSAHQHYDKDGDGILDCPYDFDDKTGSSSGSSSSSNNSSKSSVKPTVETEPSKDESSSSEEIWKKREIKNFWYPIIGCFALYAIILVADEIKWRIKK